MEPFSISASILTILSAGGQILRDLSKIINLGWAPDVLLALNNEVVDLKITINNIDSFLQEQDQKANSACLTSIANALQRTKTTLLELEQIIAYGLTKVSKDGQSLKIDRSVWMREERNIHSIKDSIRDNRIVLTQALGLFNS